MSLTAEQTNGYRKHGADQRLTEVTERVEGWRKNGRENSFRLFATFGSKLLIAKAPARCRVSSVVANLCMEGKLVSLCQTATEAATRIAAASGKPESLQEQLVSRHWQGPGPGVHHWCWLFTSFLELNTTSAQDSSFQGT